MLPLPQITHRLGAVWRQLVRGRRRRERELAQTTVADAVRQLGATLPGVEGDFLELSRQLEPLSITSHGLVAESEKLLRYASGREHGQNLVNETLGVVQGPLAYVDHCLHQQSRLLELLTQCERRNGELLKMRVTMQRTLRPLTFMSSLFKIESAGLAPELRETFLTVTSEIERMRRLVDETFAQNATTLEKSRATLAAVRLRLTDDFNRSARDIAARRRRVEEVIAKLDAQLAHNNERDLRLHRQSQDLATQVEAMVAGLQFQDIVQQKCSHVIAALEEGGGAISRAELRLQAGQLAGVGADLERGGSAISASLGIIATTVEAFDHTSVELNELKGMTAACDGMVQTLLETLNDVGETAQLMAAISRHAHETVSPLSNLATSLTTALVELSTNMRIIALNAQIRAVLSGAGTGLEQLAARTAEIAAEVDQHCEANATELAELRRCIDAMLESFGELLGRGDEQLATFASTRSTVESGLHRMRDDTLGVFQRIGAGISAVRTAVADSRRALAGMTTRRGEIAEVAASLQDLQVRLAASWLDDGGSEARRGSYTMASEHQTHAAVLGGEAAADPSGETEPELFVAPVAVAATPAKAAPRSPALAAPTELVQPAGAGAGPLAPNVELF